MTIIRADRDDDAEALIGHCWAEYPGIVLDVDREAPELRALASHYAAGGAVRYGRRNRRHVCGDDCDLSSWRCMENLAPICAVRGTGLGQELLARAEAWARQSGATRLELWSGTRFERAHSFLREARLCADQGIRPRHALSNSIEFHYAKPVSGVERLDAAAAATRLAEILIACVDSWASASFLPPPATENARSLAKNSRGDREGTTDLARWLG